MRIPKVGEIVQYFPDKRLPEFHDHGVETILPAVVAKVWEFPEGDVSVNLRVLKVDAKVLLNSNDNPPFVFGSTYSKEPKQDSWRFVEDA